MEACHAETKLDSAYAVLVRYRKMMLGWHQWKQLVAVLPAMARYAVLPAMPRYTVFRPTKARIEASIAPRSFGSTVNRSSRVNRSAIRGGNAGR